MCKNYSSKFLKMFMTVCLICLFGVFGETDVWAEGAVHRLRPYQMTDADEYYGTDGESFSMMGQKYSYGVVSGYGMKVGFNVSGMDSVSFVVGHIDGEGECSSTMKIWLDGELLENYILELTGDMINKVITINTTNHSNLVIKTFEEGYYGIGDIVGTGTHIYRTEITKICSVKSDGERIHTCIDCGYSYKEVIPKQIECNPYIYPYQTDGVDIYNEKEGSSTNFSVMGKTYYQGMVIGYESTALYNLGGQYKTFTFTVGDVNAHYDYDRTLYVYVDGIELKKIALTPYMLNQTVAVNVEGASQVKLYLQGEGGYAIFDVHAEPVTNTVKTHSFEDKVTVEAQFGVSGIVTHTCKDCGAFYTSVTKPLTRSLKQCVISLGANKYIYTGISKERTKGGLNKRAACGALLFNTLLVFLN